MNTPAQPEVCPITGCDKPRGHHVEPEAVQRAVVRYRTATAILVAYRYPHSGIKVNDAAAMQYGGRRARSVEELALAGHHDLIGALQHEAATAMGAAAAAAEVNARLAEITGGAQ